MEEASLVSRITSAVLAEVRKATQDDRSIEACKKAVADALNGLPSDLKHVLTFGPNSVVAYSESTATGAPEDGWSWHVRLVPKAEHDELVEWLQNWYEWPSHFFVDPMTHYLQKETGTVVEIRNLLTECFEAAKHTVTNVEKLVSTCLKSLSEEKLSIIRNLGPYVYVGHIDDLWYATFLPKQTPEKMEMWELYFHIYEFELEALLKD